jgi:hypothetical protein
MQLQDPPFHALPRLMMSFYFLGGKIAAVDSGLARGRDSRFVGALILSERARGEC